MKDKGQRRQRGEAYWARVVDELERSELSITAFAKRRGLPLSSLQRWRKRLREEGPTPSVRFVELESTCAPPAPPTPPVRMSLSSGIVMEFEALPPVEFVATLHRELGRC